MMLRVLPDPCPCDLLETIWRDSGCVLEAASQTLTKTHCGPSLLRTVDYSQSKVPCRREEIPLLLLHHIAFAFKGTAEPMTETMRDLKSGLTDLGS